MTQAASQGASTRGIWRGVIKLDDVFEKKDDIAHTVESELSPARTLPGDLAALTEQSAMR